MKRNLIITALDLEREAVLNHLDDIKVVKHPSTGSRYITGNWNGLEIIVARTKATNVHSATETERAVEFLSPEIVFYVGVAGGLKDVKIGDIVVGEDVYGYERAKAINGELLPRPDFGKSSYNLCEAISTFKFSNEAKSYINSTESESFEGPIEIFTGTIAAGEKVDASEKSDLHKFLKKNCSHALAVEMEGLGFLSVMHTRPTIDALLVRGISDLVENKGESDSEGSQPYAADNVARFVLEFISYLESEENSKPDQLNLTEWVFGNYPSGVKENGIWERSGGEISQISLSGNGKEQWTEAIRKLFNGGGGPGITIDRLLKEAAKDGFVFG